MPSSTTHRHYPYPLDPDPIDVAGDIKKLADAVDDDLNNSLLYRNFFSVVERDTFWPSPPPGAKCSIPYTNIPSSGATGQRRMEFSFDDGRWWPRGIALQAWMNGNQTVGIDNANVPVQYTAQSININGAYIASSSVWTAPWAGLIKMTMGTLIAIGTVALGDDAISDYRMAIGTTTPGAGWQFWSCNTRTAQVAAYGSMVVGVNAGTTHQFMVIIINATGKFKTLYGGATNNMGLMIEYI